MLIDVYDSIWYTVDWFGSMRVVDVVDICWLAIENHIESIQTWTNMDVRNLPDMWIIYFSGKPQVFHMVFHMFCVFTPRCPDVSRSCWEEAAKSGRRWRRSFTCHRSARRSFQHTGAGRACLDGVHRHAGCPIVGEHKSHFTMDYRWY